MAHATRSIDLVSLSPRNAEFLSCVTRSFSEKQSDFRRKPFAAEKRCKHADNEQRLVA
jgi:hypothetical protein